jgi:hypothetical protein
MATKSKAAAAAAAETSPEIEAQEAPVKEAAKPVDEWDETVEMVVPRKPKGEDQQYYICVNDRRFMVPADGKVQALPRPVAEILQESVQAEYAADDFADHIPNRSGDNPQQHAI